MADSLNQQERSALMSRIRSKNTKPELTVRRYLHSKGLRFRLHVQQLPGRPDLVLKRWRAVVVVQGCFWHGHRGCPHYRLPKTRVEFWRAKIQANRSRDTRNCFRLAGLGWRVFTVWECELAPKVRKDTLARLHARLTDLAERAVKSSRHRKQPLRKTVRFAPGTDAQTRKRRIGRVVKRMDQPLVAIRLLKEGHPPVAYSDANLLVADRARLYFADVHSQADVKGASVCVECGQLLQEDVWEAQDGLCSHCWSQAA